MSGLNQQFTKLSTLNRVREFESHILRIDNLVSESTHVPMGVVRPRWIICKAKSAGSCAFCFSQLRIFLQILHAKQSKKIWSMQYQERCSNAGRQNKSPNT
jgi:hypothetical protein